MGAVSNGIRYDSLLVRYVARELDRRLGRARVHSLRLDPEARRLALETERDVLVWELHPLRGQPRLVGAPPAGPSVRLPRQARILGASSAPDERIVVIRIGGAGAAQGRTRAVIVELVTNQWNAVAVDGADRIIAVLQPRDAGGRSLRRGRFYQPPEPTRRAGRADPVGLEEWHALLDEVAPSDRPRLLARTVAYMSPLNAAPILGAAAAEPTSPPEGAEDLPAGAPERVDPAEQDRANLLVAYHRYRALAALPAPSPGWIGERRFPYPIPLPGLRHEPAPDLIEALSQAGEPAPSPPRAAPRVGDATLARLRHELGRAGRRAERLAEQLEEARPGAAALRAEADLILARSTSLRRGQEEVELEGFAGEVVAVRLDPALDAVQNAGRRYEEARKRERAAERLPALIEDTRGRIDRLRRLLEAAVAGEADEEEVAAALGSPARGDVDDSGAASGVLPYRRYRSSGSLEIRVGRNRKANDDLTFRNSSPDDVWLHARDAAGAHVILRWNDARNGPPARDLAEAAGLAALHSRARTSGVVAVDWTRRKYVRKPRGAPPGAVVPDRVKTLFVEPDPGLPERLAGN